MHALQRTPLWHQRFPWVISPLLTCFRYFTSHTPRHLEDSHHILWCKLALQTKDPIAYLNANNERSGFSVASRGLLHGEMHYTIGKHRNFDGHSYLLPQPSYHDPHTNILPRAAINADAVFVAIDASASSAHVLFAYYSVLDVGVFVCICIKKKSPHSHIITILLVAPSVCD